MPRLKKRIYDFDESINDFMIYCTNKDLTKKTMKSYESTLKLFAKYLYDEMSIFTPIQVTTKHIKDYLEFKKTKGKFHKEITKVASEKLIGCGRATLYR